MLQQNDAMWFGVKQFTQLSIFFNVTVNGFMVWIEKFF